MEVSAVLPYPVSVNNCWFRSKKGVYLNPKIKIYRHEVWAIMFVTERFNDKKIRLEIDVYPPDKRHRDIDNICKVAIDSLQHAGVFNDDSQVHQLYVEKKEHVKFGKLKITIKEIE